MNPIINGDIDIGKCLKEHFRIDGNGRRYMDIKLYPTPNSKFGTDYMVIQHVSKEARLAGIKGPIIGNARIAKPITEDTPFDEPIKKKSDIPY